MRIKIPSIYGITSASEFFKNMTLENKAVTGFSQRSLSTLLKWPVSYIPDVIKERKPFTVARSLEFIRQFKVNPIDAEHLIFLAVASQSKIDFASLKSIRVEKKPELSSNKMDVDLYSFEVLFIFEIIRWFHGKASKDKIIALLPKKKVNPSQVDKVISILEKKKMIKESNGIYKAIEKSIFSDESLGPAQERLLHQDFAENLKQFYDNFNTPACGSTSFVQLEISRFEEIRDKITSLRNWIQEISSIDSENSESKEIMLFQLDFYLTAQFNRVNGQSIKHK